MFQSRFSRHAFALTGLLLGVLDWAAQAQAQTQPLENPPLVLRPSSLLPEIISGDTRKQLPTFLQSDAMTGQPDIAATLDGDARMRRGDLLLKADHIEYDQIKDQVKAQGHVYVNRSGNVYEGPELQLQLESFEGFFTDPNFRLLRNQAHGQAQRIDFIDNANSVLHDADYTTCQRKPGPSWTPDWFFKATTIHLDTDHNIGLAEGASLYFKDVPILPVPEMDFPLNDARKSGLLPPVIGVDNIGGLEYTQPYYWNLAPNRDMTFFPTYWSRRGLNFGTELRYLERAAPQPPFQGTMRFDFMENDLLRNASRWRMMYNHLGVSQPPLAGGALDMSFNIQRVSDDNYWKDFSMLDNNGVQRLLTNDITLRWARGNLSTSLVAQKWQTLQDLDNPANYITPPFDRMPQLGVHYQRTNLGGFDFVADEQMTRFESVRDIDCVNQSITCAPNATRNVAIAQLSRPFVLPAFYVTPKVQMLTRSYQFDGGLLNAPYSQDHIGQTSASTTVPTASLDVGMVLERNKQLFGRNWTQTLEPRAFYVYTPFRDQNYLPNYDSGSNAYNFASVFTENRYGGYDRISDSKQVTMGLTTRFLDPETGAEGARFGLAQRYQILPQRVLLPGETASGAGLSDLLLGASTTLTPRWALDSTVQYNPTTRSYLRRMVAMRFNPSPYRVVSAAYRMQNDQVGIPATQQLDIGWQWPLHDLWRDVDEDVGPGRGLGEGRWYSVARMNYSAIDKKVVESVIGFEYDAGCWLGRVVSEQVQVADGLARKRLLFQLEFVGFSQLGTNALGSLRSNVPRYQNLRQPTMAPSRFGNYD